MSDRQGAGPRRGPTRFRSLVPFLVALSNQLKVDDTELEGLPNNVVRFRNFLRDLYNLRSIKRLCHHPIHLCGLSFA